MANFLQIEEFLKVKQIPHQIVDLGGEVFTVDQVKKTGVEEDEIVKTLVIKTNNNFIALVVRGCDRLDFKKVRRLFGPSTALRVNCELAKADEVEKVCGVPVRVMNLTHVNIGSGDLTKGLEMKLSDLLAAVGKYQVEDLVI